MRRLLLIFTLALFVLSLSTLPIFAKEIGIIINDKFIKPGDSVFYLVSQTGFPDGIKAVRGKNEEFDFIVFIYKSKELRIDINNNTNLLQGIMVQNNDVKIEGMSFKIGDDFKEVIAVWGKPDVNFDADICYWEKGIYFKTDQSGRIIQIYIAEPNNKENLQPVNV